jgi:hypothetical protein
MPDEDRADGYRVGAIRGSFDRLRGGGLGPAERDQKGEYEGDCPTPSLHFSSGCQAEHVTSRVSSED